MRGIIQGDGIFFLSKIHNAINWWLDEHLAAAAVQISEKAKDRKYTALFQELHLHIDILQLLVRH